MESPGIPGRFTAENRRILVTGASGFIGRHLLDALKEDFQITL